MKNNKCIYVIIFLLGQSLTSFAQVPDVINVNKTSGTYGEVITISGNGFSDNSSELSVHFGASAGHIISSTEYLIEAMAPSGANYNNVSVTNLKSGSTGFATSFYTPAFGGTGFETSRIIESKSIQEEVALFDLCNCDFNGDGLNDVVTTNNSEDAGSTSITVYQNTTADNDLEISFQKVFEPNLITGKAARNVTCGDLDGDGKPELVVGKGGGNADRIYIFKNSSNATISFASALTILLTKDISSSTTRRLKIHDLDKNGRPDIIMTDQGKGRVFIFENRSTGNMISFPDEYRQSIQTSAGSLVGLDVADLNNDGKPEIICNSDKSDVFIIGNNSVAGFIDMGNPEQRTITGATLVNTKIGDLDNDGDKDVIISNFVNNIYIMINEGNENSYSFSTPKYVETGRAPWGLDLGDINGDGLVDIVVTTTDQADQMTTLINSSSGSGISFDRYQIGSADISFNINVSDFNGDAKPDIGYINRKNNNLIFLRNSHCIVADIFPKIPPRICSNNPVKLRSIPAPKAAYVWTNTTTSEITQGDFRFDVTAPGTYTVEIKSDAGSCASSSGEVTIIDGGDNLPPTVNITNPGFVCEGGDFKLTAEVVPGIEYLWRFPDGRSAVGNEIEVTDAKAEDGGRYSLILESAGCKTDPKAALVEIISLPTIEIASSLGTLFCEGKSSTLSVANVPDALYKWYLDGSLIAGITTNSLLAEAAGTYAVILENQYSCTENSPPLAINQIKQPIAQYKEVLSACLNQEIKFENTSTFDASETPVFQWDFGDGEFSSDENPTHVYIQSGNYTVSLLVGYNNATCSSLYQSSLEINEFIDLTILVEGATISEGIYNLCDGNQAELSVNVPSGKVEWSTGETTSKIVIADQGAYSVKYGKSTACSSNDEIMVNLVDNVSLEITTGSQRIESGSSAQLGVQGADYYHWEPADDLDNAEIPNPLASPDYTTEYTVTGWNNFGCQDSATVTVFVDEKITVPVDAPRAFTPNGDGQNDEWRIKNLELFESCPIRIFNRKGQNVYESSEYENDWNGIFNGKELPEGAYYYVITCGGGQMQTGDITLIR